ncbi:lytic transglycosylase domain-containing protein [Hoylesella shahii]|jgi:hypothetical protein|uniref:lytic transglycosylase domain-containing protein n=1 Tax=Hoylesella shahii TaxID=228603 RepID=UPI00248EC3E1|nr:lytic transglycosylase domain-containing protein [Hoylesella shahii]
MERSKRIVFLCFTILSLLPGFAHATKNEDNVANSNFSWEPVMEAIIQVESGGNRFAKSGKSVGPMQITPICVKEVNLYLKQLNIKKAYTLKDRFSVEKSKEIFLLIQKRHNPKNNVERAIRAWNGGLKYCKKGTQRYYEKVTRLMNKTT